MKQRGVLNHWVLVVSLFSVIWLLWGQTSSAAAPNVPITYPGDTDQTIMRRAQWIEGAKKEGQIVFWGTLTPDAGARVIAEFNKVYPFLKGVYWRGRGEEIAAKLDPEYMLNRSPVDIVHGGEPINFPRWRKMGMMVPLLDILPSIQTIDKRLYSKYGDWATPGHTVVTPHYNTRLIASAEVPKQWEDLGDPKWKGQIGLSSDVKAWVALALGEGGWGVERTEDFLRKLALQNLIWSSGHTAGHTMMIAGEFKIMAEGYLYHVIRSQRRGAPVNWIKTKPAVVNSGPNLHLSAKAPHPNAARLFAEWLFSPDGFLMWEDKSGGMGAAFPGLGTHQSKVLEGVTLVAETEEVIQQGIELKLTERFSRVLGIIK